MKLQEQNKARFLKRRRGCIKWGMVGVVLALVLLLITGIDSFGPTVLLAVSLMGLAYAWLLQKLMAGEYIILHKIVGWLMGGILISFFCLEFMVFQGMKTDLPESCRYLIVLGAGLNGDYPSATLQQRLDAGLVFLHSHPQTQVILSGGVGKESDYTEAEVMKWYLMNRGIGEERIIEEVMATRTDENLLFGKRLVETMTGERMDEIVIATSDYHMFRSKLIAAKYYDNVYGIVAPSPYKIQLYYAMREYFALVKMGILESYEQLKIWGRLK